MDDDFIVMHRICSSCSGAAARAASCTDAVGLGRARARWGKGNLARVHEAELAGEASRDDAVRRDERVGERGLAVVDVGQHRQVPDLHALPGAAVRRGAQAARRRRAELLPTSARVVTEVACRAGRALAVQARCSSIRPQSHTHPNVSTAQSVVQEERMGPWGPGLRGRARNVPRSSLAGSVPALDSA